MKRLLFTMISAVLISLYPVNAMAYDFSVNPFYAIRSSSEYESIKDTIGDSDTIYFGWSRIARNSGGQMVFTSDRSPISKFDIYTEYAIPEPIEDRLPNEIRKAEHPNGRNMLMVFLNKIEYDDGKESIIEFLNMGRENWDNLIIQPLINTMKQYGFDGAVLDIEGIMDSFGAAGYDSLKDSGLKEKYDTFIKEIKDKLGSKELSVCVNMPEFSGYDYSGIYDNADEVILLAYPYTHYITYDENDGVPELVGRIKEIDVPEAQPYEMVKNDTDKILSELKQTHGAKFNPKKIMLGITLEINGWAEKEYTYQSKTYKYYEKTSSTSQTDNMSISTINDIEKLNVPYDYVSQSPVYKYLSKTCKKVVQLGGDSNIKRIEYYYDIPGTIFEKYYTMLTEYNLSGITVWRLGLGSISTWNLIDSAFSPYGEGYEELPLRVDVPVDKVWDIKFNMPVDEKTVYSLKDGIAVLDGEGNNIPVNFSFDSGAGSIKVAPKGRYKNGNVYCLIIGPGIRSKTGIKISKPVFMKFKTME